MSPDETTDADESVVDTETSTSNETASEEVVAATEEEEDGPISLDDEPIPDGDEASLDEDEDAQEDESENETAEEMLEFTFGGNKLEVPKDSVTPELAEKIDEFAKGTWSTFTRGQQENIERAKSLDARETTVAKLTSLNGEALQVYSRGLYLRSEIAQLRSVDMSALWQSDQDRARQISDLLNSKQAEFDGIVAKVGETETAIAAEETAEVERLDAEGEVAMNRQFKNFSTEKVPDLIKYVVETCGMSQEEAQKWRRNPLMTTFAYKAFLFDQQAAAAKNAASKPPTQAKPVKAVPVKGKATNVEKDPDKMSMGQLSKHLGLIPAA